MDVPDYDLPDEAIAQHPLEPRDAARLLVSPGPDQVEHRLISDLPSYVGPGDVVVVNTSRVLPARLRLRKRSGGVAEVLLLEADPDTADPATAEPGTAEAGTGSPATGAGGRLPPGVPPAGPGRTWRALVRPGRRLPPGTVLVDEAGEALVEVGDRLADGLRRVRLLRPDALERAGQLALPPYIRAPLADPERYQTVYSDRPGSVAAPTAGLHLTERVLDGLRATGAQVCHLDLAVGLATFRPVTADDAGDHVMHRERYRVPAATWEACRRAERVVAVGTTTVRALESAAASGRLEGASDLFIQGPYPFAVVDVLLTNFHQARSTLLLLLEAFVGPRWRDLYALALAEGYRFLSFGDAMLVARAARA